MTTYEYDGYQVFLVKGDEKVKVKRKPGEASANGDGEDGEE